MSKNNTEKTIQEYIQQTEDIDNVKKYIENLNKMEYQTLYIAIEHLETSFNIEKSIGYKNWKKKIRYHKI
tara:strand:- start:191 stop:400 length:210 start_codon:yes stop_codon:yes gene_type:complete